MFCTRLLKLLEIPKQNILICHDVTPLALSHNGNPFHFQQRLVCINAAGEFLVQIAVSFERPPVGDAQVAPLLFGFLDGVGGGHDKDAGG